MTPRKAIREVPASVRQRLQNLSREQGADIAPVLQRYAIERFLYRLSASEEVDRFTLKGEELRRFLGPVCDSLIAESPFIAGLGLAGGPWQAWDSGTDGRRSGD